MGKALQSSCCGLRYVYVDGVSSTAGLTAVAGALIRALARCTETDEVVASDTAEALFVVFTKTVQAKN